MWEPVVETRELLGQDLSLLGARMDHLVEGVYYPGSHMDHLGKGMYYRMDCPEVRVE